MFQVGAIDGYTLMVDVSKDDGTLSPTIDVTCRYVFGNYAIPSNGFAV